MPLPERCLTVIVPTLWKAESFPTIAAALAESRIVARIIVIDNNPIQAVRLAHPRIEVITKGVNIYVNPAWNFGMRHASSRYACLLNDDIDATPELLEYAVSILENDRDESLGLIGMDWESDDRTLSHRKVDGRITHFGSAMFFRVKDYSPIPNPLKIWCGDDYLLLRAQLKGKQVVVISGFGRIAEDQSSVSINSDKPRFKSILKRDLRLWQAFYRRLLYLRYRPIRTIFGGGWAKISRIFSAS